MEVILYTSSSWQYYLLNKYVHFHDFGFCSVFTSCHRHDCRFVSSPCAFLSCYFPLVYLCFYCCLLNRLWILSSVFCWICSPVLDGSWFVSPPVRLAFFLCVFFTNFVAASSICIWVLTFLEFLAWAVTHIHDENVWNNRFLLSRTCPRLSKLYLWWTHR